jgi:hypothetical protein
VRAIGEDVRKKRKLLAYALQMAPHYPARILLPIMDDVTATVRSILASIGRPRGILRAMILYPCPVPGRDRPCPAGQVLSGASVARIRISVQLDTQLPSRTTAFVASTRSMKCGGRNTLTQKAIA